MPPSTPEISSSSTRVFYTVLIVLCLLFLLPVLIQNQNLSSSSSTTKEKSKKVGSRLDVFIGTGDDDDDGQQQQNNSSSSSSSSSSSDSPPEISSSSSSSSPPISFPNFIQTLLSDSLSSDWTGVFDDDIILRQQEYSSFLDEEVNFPCFSEMSAPWGMKRGLYEVQMVPPSCLQDQSKVLKTIHFMISIGISRMKYDKSMDDMYQKIQQMQNSPAVLVLFEKKIAQILVSYLQAASIALQIYIDGWGSPSFNTNELLNQLRDITATPTNSKRKTSSSSSLSNSLIIKKKKAARWLKKRSNLITLTPYLKWDTQFPVNGRFWNNFRQTLPCSSLHRTCENPEGCRFTCNLEYSIEKALMEQQQQQQQQSSSATSGAAGYTMVGFGSNNEFDWEDSMINAFDSYYQKQFLKGNSKKKNEKSIMVAPGLASITTFDCTLITRPGHPGVRPSPTVKKIDDRFRFVPFCVDGKANELIAVTNDQNTRTKNGNDKGNSKKMSEIFASKEAEAMSISFAELRQVLEWKDASGDDETARSPTIQQQSSRKINLLKVDVESFEYPALARWLQLDLYQIRKQFSKNEMMKNKEKQNDEENNDNRQNGKKNGDATSSIDFKTFPFLEVEQLQIELHRRGHTNNRGASAVGAIWLMWPQLTMYALGMTPVVAEKNHFDNCCFEEVLVHYRFYVESELWVLMK